MKKSLIKEGFRGSFLRRLFFCIRHKHVWGKFARIDCGKKTSQEPFDEEKIALEGAVMQLSNAIIKTHKIPCKDNNCVLCFALKCTSFIRTGISAKLADELRVVGNGVRE